MTITPVHHPRGEVHLPHQQMKVGARVRMIRSGAEGTISYVVPRTRRVGYGCRVKWDSGAEGRVVAPAFDLEPVE